jgi:hypothetical protein
VFDYTASSIERRQGFVVLMGERVESVGFAQDQVAPAPRPAAYAPVVNVTMTFGVQRPAQPQITSQIETGIENGATSGVESDLAKGTPNASVPPSNVQDLAEWRRTRRSDEPLH